MFTKLEIRKTRVEDIRITEIEKEKSRSSSSPHIIRLHNIRIRWEDSWTWIAKQLRKVIIRLWIRIQIGLKFNQLEKRKSISNLVNFVLIDQILIQS